MASRLLLPVNNLRNAGFEMERREALEVHFDKLRLEEPLQYLTVPKDEEQDVKALGGRYDQVAASWYVPPASDIDDFARWDRPSTLTPGAEFAGVMRHHGLAIEGEAVMDGEWHRVPLHGQESDTKPAGLYRSASDGGPGGEFRNYRDGDGHMVEWIPAGYRASPDIRTPDTKQHEERCRAEHKRAILAQADAARRAKGRWQRGISEFDAATHDFLGGVGVGAHGIRMTEIDKSLLVPARDVNGGIHTLQMIWFDPEEGRFRTDLTANARIRGCCHLIGEDRSGRKPLIVTEDYVTAAAIHEASGRPVAVAFEGYNLKPVAEALRSKMPDREIVVAANCDQLYRIRDIGLEEARDAARAVGGVVAIPHLPEHMLNTDHVTFARVAAEMGSKALRHQIEAVVGAAAGKTVLVEGDTMRGSGREPPVLMSLEPVPEGCAQPDERVARQPAERRPAGRSR